MAKKDEKYDTTPASGGPQPTRKGDADGNGIPDVLADPAKRRELMQKYGFSEGDLRLKSKRDLFYQAVRKDMTRKEAKQAYGNVYVNDEATVREIIDQAGFTIQLLNQYPELRLLFKRLSDMLARGVITEANLYPKFEELLADTEFAKRPTSEVQADLQRYGTETRYDFNQSVQRVIADLQDYLTQEIGSAIDPAKAEELAIQLIYSGDTSVNAIKRLGNKWISDNKTMLDESGNVIDLGGQRGNDQDNLLRWFSANGLVVTGNELSNWLSKLSDGSTSIDQIKQYYRDKKFSLDYAGFADEFAQGFDVSDIAMNYRQIMAGLLEKNIEDINLNDPLVQRAMQNRDETGKPKPLTKYDFERMVRESPDWDKTTNAMSSYVDIGESILRSFGFRG